MKNRNISFEYPKKSLLKSSYPKKILAEIFLPPKNPEIENFKPPKILRSSLSLEIRRTPLGHKWLMTAVLTSVFDVLLILVNAVFFF